MKFGILTQYFPPEIGAPQNRLSELAERLVIHGHQVYVLTAMPNYPLGRVYPGFGGLFRKEFANGVKIIRTAIYPTQKASLLPRLTNYFSFVISSILIGGWYLPELDYLLTESPPLFLGISGYLISRWKSARWIFNVSDLWPESAVRLGVLSEGPALNLSKALEAFCYRKSWIVSGQTKSILDDVTHRFPEVKVYHLSNGVDTELFTPQARTDEARKLLGDKDEVVVLYAGLHGLAQGLEQIIHTAEGLSDLPFLRFVFIGDGPQKHFLTQEVERRHLGNIKFLDPVQKSVINTFVASSDIYIITLKTFIPGAMPSKIYEAMACGRPIILAADGEAADIVRSHCAGIVVQPADITGLSNALRLLAGDHELRYKMGSNGRKAAELFYDRNSIVNKFEDFLLMN